MGLRHEEPPRGHEDERGRRRGLEGEVRREAGDVPRGHDDVLRVPAVDVLSQDLVIHAHGVLPADAVLALPACEPRVHDDPFADLEVPDVVAGLRDLARDVAPEDVREWELQGRHPLADEEVEVVQRARAHPHEDVRRAKDRFAEVRDVL